MANALPLQQINLRLPDAPERAFRHRGTPADLGVLAQMFESQDYALERLRRGAEMRALYDGMVSSARRPLILDAGANIGASVVYFGLRFPRAHILALEPAGNNFSVLEANVGGLDVDIRCAAIGAASGRVAVTDPGNGEWGYRTVAAQVGETVPMHAAGQLIAEKNRQGYAPFIAKIDIEGGEADLFSRDTGWVDEFPLLIIELHDWLLPQQGTSRSFLKCIAALDRDFVYLGENIFSIRNDWTGTDFRV